MRVHIFLSFGQRSTLVAERVDWAAKSRKHQATKKERLFSLCSPSFFFSLQDLSSQSYAEARPGIATAAIKPKASVSSGSVSKPSSSASSDRSELFQGASASASSSSRAATDDEQATGIRSSQIRGHRTADEIKRAYGREPK